jgi:hypothetical protein
MEPYTLLLLALVLGSALGAYLCISEREEAPLEREVTRQESQRQEAQRHETLRQGPQRTRRLHPVLGQNVAVARLMKLESDRG